MMHQQVKLLLIATTTLLALLQSTSAYMSPMMPMAPMGGVLNPMNPYGYHVARKRRHRNIFQRITGTGRRYKYYVRPNSYMSRGMGMNPMNPVGMGGMSMMPSPMGIHTTSYGMSTMGMNPMGMGMNSMSMGGMNPMGMGMGGTKDFKNTVRSASALSHACRSNDTNTLRHVSCPYMSHHDLHYCFTRASDPFLNALVRKCKGVFTSNPYQLAAFGVEMILANKPMPFGSIVTRSTCAMMGAYEKQTLLKTAILSRTQNSYAFVDHILNTCNVPLNIMAHFQTLALTTGDMSVSMRMQRAAMYPTNPYSRQKIIYAPSGRIINLLNDGALSLMTGRDMAMFGKIGRTCSSLRPEHLTHPMFNAELLNQMNENCFKHLKPRIFWYMSSDTIKRFRWWRSATPAQIRMIPMGKPIQAVPFFLLGQHAYVNKLDRYHPCAGITKSQRISIQMEPKTARAFYERCKASNAMAVKASATMIISALIAYLVFLA